MKGHTLLVQKGFAILDGKKILTEDGQKEEVEGVLQIYRHNGGPLGLTKEQLAQLDGPKTKHWIGTYDKWSKRKGLYILKLPNLVEVWIETSGDSRKWTLASMIRMPPQANQGGYCGNFNGDPKDDQKEPTDGEGVPGGPMLDPIDKSLDLFKASKEFSSSMIQEGEGHEDTKERKKCSKGLKAKAKKACSHIPEKSLHEDCVFDI